MTEIRLKTMDIKGSQMRLRNIQGARDTIAESPLVIHEPEKAKGNWRELFGNSKSGWARGSLSMSWRGEIPVLIM